MNQKRFLFLLYCLRFDNSTTKDQRKDIDKLAPIRGVYERFVTSCKDNYTPGIDCTVDESLLGFRGRCAFKQYIPNKPSKYGIKVYVLADSLSFYSVSSKIYAGAGTNHQDYLYLQQAVLDLITPISGTNKNITTVNYYTSISLANELKSSQLTLVGTMKKNKRCIPSSFLTKADAGTCQYVFDDAKNFTLLSIAPKKNKRVVFLSTMHATRSQDSVSGKEEINVFYNHKKGGVDSYDQMCALYTIASKINCWPMRVFYGIVDSSALNAFVIFTHNTHGFGGNRKDKRQKSLKELSKSLIISQAKSRLITLQTPQALKQIIYSCGILPEERTSVQNINQYRTSGRKRCFFCPRSKDKKYRFACSRCHNTICEEHSKMICNLCQE